MRCNEVRNHFAEYLTEELESSSQEEFARHLKECPACRAELEELTDFWVKLGSIPPGEPASSDLEVRLRAAAEAYERGLPQTRRGRRFWKQGLALAAAAVIVLTVFLGMWWRSGAAAVLESEGSRRVGYGEAVRANTGAGSVLVLRDGSRVEMRSQAELSLERADDGVRIRLNQGGVIVNAVKQQNRHLYVQTKDVTVSVVGTVFLVNAEQEGSRVAVIEGEVRVQQPGTAEVRLLPGEQVKTNPLMEPQLVKEEISWSKNAVTHIALLEQSAAVSASRQSSTETRLAFEETSIRPAGAGTAVTGGRGAGSSAVSGCNGSYQIQIDPRRFAVFGTTLHNLVIWAYGTGPLNYQDCKNVTSQNLISGGPDWLRSDLWDVQALIPEGALNYTPEQVKKGDAPKFRMMLQALLATRFQLLIRSETKEGSAYVLTADKGAPRLTLSADLDTPQFREELVNPKQPGVVPERGAIFVKNAPIADLIPILEQDIGKPVLDQTGLKSQYSFFIEYTPLSRINGGGTLFTGPSLFKALPEQVGLRLTETKTTVTIWTIERAEKPSEN